jgi:hypothetical protein
MLEGELKMAKIVSQSSAMTSNRGKSMPIRATDSLHISNWTSVFSLKRVASAILSLVLFAASLASPIPLSAQAGKHGAEVEIGVPKILEYSRVYPLLDGLFQDVAATQLASLTLNPNSPNASALDALQQVFQLQLQYSATAGIQNNLAAQQSATASTFASFQNALLQQQSQLVAAQFTAQQQVGAAQQAMDSLANPTADQTAAAKQRLQVATDNLNSITAQLTGVQNALGKSLTTSPTFNAVTPSPQTNPPTLPSIPAPAPPSSPSGYSPNFPATKQMDNQITLLWERLARLVETLNQGNNPDENLYLVEFDTNIMPRGRNHQLLNIRYPLAGCTGGQQPYVLDMYPRNAAVNVLNEKYKETRFGLGALLSFFSFGLNASYNRDHLQISQALSQSSYITGYGVGQSAVGWLYGISLGDDSIAAGVRSVYALIAVPSGCTGAQISPPTVEWTKDPAMTEGKKLKVTNENVVMGWNSKLFSTQSADAPRCPNTGCVSKIMYSPVEYGTSDTQAPVMVTATLAPSTATLDKEEMINVNGRYLQRARDNFGRAVVATGITGSGGILETGTLSVNTWLPVSSTTFVMNLDGVLFKNKFPNVLLQSPRGVIDLTNSFIPNAEVVISGVNWDCSTNCGYILPQLARQKLSEGRIAIARWAASGPPEDPNDSTSKRLDQLCITVLEGASNQPSAAQSTTTSALQILTDTDLNVWGSRPSVVLDYNLEFNDRMSPIKDCQALGARWVCRVVQSWRDREMVVRIEDFEHLGGTFVGKGILPACQGDQCTNPFVWRNPAPVWNDPDGAQNAWTLTLPMANLQENDKMTLSNAQKWSLPAEPLNCKDFSKICDVRFSIPKNQFDNIRGTTLLRVLGADGKPRGTSSNLALRSAISPVVTVISPDQLTFSGRNLVFDKIQIGENGKPIPILCNAAADATQCSLAKYDPDVKGYLFFLTSSSTVPVIRSSDGTQILHDPAAIKAAAAPPPAAAAAQPAPLPPEKKPSVPVSQSQPN